MLVSHTSIPAAIMAQPQQEGTSAHTGYAEHLVLLPVLALGLTGHLLHKDTLLSLEDVADTSSEK